MVMAPRVSTLAVAFKPVTLVWLKMFVDSKKNSGFQRSLMGKMRE